MGNEELEKYSIVLSDSILQAVKKMDEVDTKLLVVLKNGLFESLLSIGDIQRGIIKGVSMELPVTHILRNKEKIKVATIEDSLETVHKNILDYKMEFMPIIDQEGKVQKLIFWENVYQGRPRVGRSNLQVPVVVMAGGKGTRLKPITNVIPKALVPVEEKPIIEVIMDRFARMGARQFYVTVNYKAEMLKNYLGQTPRHYQIDYIDEDTPLGTAGSLALIGDKIQSTFFVTNCDILIDDDYEQFYRYHKDEGNELTIIAALKHYEIPYGILETKENGQLSSIREKPEFTYQVNSGMYILESHLIKEIPNNKFFHITDLMEKILKRKGKVGVFPVSERSWMDIGEWNEYNKTRDILAKRGIPFS